MRERDTPFKRAVWAHLWRYRVGRNKRPHPAWCGVCAHPCPGRGCMTTIHDPYQVLCSFCAGGRARGGAGEQVVGWIERRGFVRMRSR